MRKICLVVLLFSLGYSLNVVPLGLAPSSTSKPTSEFKFHSLGRHLIVDMSECTFPTQELDYALLLWFAAYKSGAEVLKVETHQFDPQGDYPAGWTGVALLGESHISVHTWPEYNYAAVDIFTCGDHVDMMASLMFLIALFNPNKINYTVCERGYDGPDE